MTKTTAPYGSWASTVTADLVAGQSLRFGHMQALGERLFWTEVRPAERGRGVVVERTADGRLKDVVPAPFSARSRVHEYGGGEFLAAASTVWFVNDADQDIYAVTGDAVPQRLTRAPKTAFSDMVIDARRNRLIAVAEVQDAGEDGMPENLLVSIRLDEAGSGTVTPLAQGCDFYACPRLSPDGTRLAWIEWDLPAMPWEAARLMVAGVGPDGAVAAPRRVEAGEAASVFQPEWAPDGSLVFVSDASGWGNLARSDGDTVTPLWERAAEFGRPMWTLGTRAFAIDDGGRITASFIDEGIFRLGRVDAGGGAEKIVAADATQIDSPCTLGTSVAAIVTQVHGAPAVAIVSDLETDSARIELVRGSLEVDLDPATISQGRLLTIAGSGPAPVRALYYPPANPAFEGPRDSAPPVIVAAHGGPTGMAERGLKLKIQYWTSRGFAYLDVDYRGSWGYGRAYREALDGKWGVADVEDVVAVTQHLVRAGLGDGDRLVISGGSAGGFTVLCALTFHDLFAAGASYYGIGDLQKLADLTHKFESGYIYALTGTAPGRTAEVFEARSPLAHAGRLSRPVIFFQGMDDKVVPPGQSRDMVASLKGRGVPCAYLEFEGEGHGFRRAETIVRALRSEYAFYARVLGLGVREDVARVDIFNEERLQ
jgi:dipeptidyl aminopeptidase/acylaminoacyl peptidase